MDNMDFLRSSIGTRIKEIRKQNNMTLNALSKLTDTSVSFLSEIENGKKFPSIKLLYLINKKLNISLDSIISETN